MKAKILSIILLMCFAAVADAQTTGNIVPDGVGRQPRGMMTIRDQKGPMSGLNLTDVQKESFKQSMMAMQKQIQPLKGELGEAEAHQKTLMTAEKPDLNAINKNIEKIGSIRVEIAKIQVKHRLDMRAQLTEEQRMKFDLMKEMFGDDHGMRGMMKGRRMQESQKMN